MNRLKVKSMMKFFTIALIFLFIAIGMDKPLCCGATNWGSTGWGGEVRYVLGMRTSVGGGITEYYVPNVGWVS
jgi:hypothetical protein